MAPPRAILFDAYGTLFDVHCVAGAMDEMFPGKGEELASACRQKKLEYTRLLTMAGPNGERYLPFSEVTRRALRFCCKQLKLELAQEREEALMQQYRKLTPFPEVADTLAALKAKGLPLAILTNGDLPFIQAPVDAAGLGGHFDAIISVDPARVYKPHPAVYTLGLEGARKLLAAQRQGVGGGEGHSGGGGQAGRSSGSGGGGGAEEVAARDVLLVSSNCWDVCGAGMFGLRTFWVNRGGSPAEELGVTPDHEGSSLSDLLKLFE